MLQAIQTDDLETFYALFNDDTADFGQEYYENHENALHIAVKSGSHAVAIALAEMSHEMDLDLLDGRDDAGYTPIMYAAQSETDDVELINALLNSGARAGLDEALKFAAQRGHVGMVARLIDSDVDSVQVLAEIAQHDSSDGGVSAAKLLISTGADATNALIYASEKGWRTAESALLMLGANGSAALVSVATQEAIRGTSSMFTFGGTNRLIAMGADAATALIQLAQSPRSEVNSKAARVLIGADRDPGSYYEPTPAEGIALSRLIRSRDTAALQMWIPLRPAVLISELAKAGEVGTLKPFIASHPDISEQILQRAIEGKNLLLAKTMVAAGTSTSTLIHSLPVHRDNLPALRLAILAGAPRSGLPEEARADFAKREIRVSQYSPTQRQAALLSALWWNDVGDVAILLNTKVDVGDALRKLREDANYRGLRTLFASGLRTSDVMLESVRAGDMRTAKFMTESRETDASTEVLRELIAYDQREPARALLGLLNDRGRQALTHAAASDDIPFAVALMELGADGPGALIELLSDQHRAAALRLIAAGVNIHTTLTKTAEMYTGTTRDNVVRDLVTAGADWLVALQQASELDDKEAIKSLATRAELGQKMVWVLDHETMATEEKTEWLRLMIQSGVPTDTLAATLAENAKNAGKLRLLTAAGMRTDDLLVQMSKQGNRIDARNLILGGGNYIEAMRSLRADNQHQAITVLGLALTEARDRMMAP
ncbi:hypothetical protein GCM10027287_25340 [Bordetella muralis]